MLFGLISFCVFGCAKIQAPPGGPEDRTPPKIEATVPLTGSVNVDRLAPVRIVFTEPIVKDKLEELIYISPRPPSDPEFGGGKTEITIRWLDSLAANTTYILTIAAQIADLRRNRLITPYILAFSTGPAIDSGTVNGIVYHGDKPAANTQVLLFGLPLDSATAVYAPPDYITESGADGAYTFSYLPAGPYRAIAAVDKNKNRALDHSEKSGVGAFDVSLTATNHISPPLLLHLLDVDTTRFELVQGRVNQDRVLLVEFSHQVDTTSIKSADWSVVAVDGRDTVEVVAVSPDLKDKHLARLSLADADVGISYRLHVDGLCDDSGTPLDTLFNTAEIFWPSAPDTTAPQVIGSSPKAGAKAVNVDHQFYLWFSEPVDTALVEGSFYLADSAGERVDGDVVWPGPWKLTFTPTAELTGGKQYLLVLDSTALVDAAGNSSATRWAADFTTFDPQELGTISGSLSVDRDDWFEIPVKIDFTALKQKAFSRSFTFAGPESFTFDIPAGRYVIRALVDLNSNGRFDPGVLIPYTPAEPRITFPDTVEVRARFTTEAVDLSLQ